MRLILFWVIFVVPECWTVHNNLSNTDSTSESSSSLPQALIPGLPQPRGEIPPPPPPPPPQRSGAVNENHGDVQPPPPPPIPSPPPAAPLRTGVEDVHDQSELSAICLYAALRSSPILVFNPQKLKRIKTKVFKKISDAASNTLRPYLSSTAPYRPRAGTVFIYPRTIGRDYHNDGYRWHRKSLDTLYLNRRPVFRCYRYFFQFEHSADGCTHLFTRRVTALKTK
eukprot:96940_1